MRRRKNLSWRTNRTAGHGGETPERSAVCGEPPRKFTRRFFPTQAKRRRNRSWRTVSAARHVGNVAAGISPPESTAHTENFRKQLRFGRVFSDLFWVAFFRSDGTETKRGEQVGRRCFFERVGSVFASLESTPSSGKHKHRRGRCADGAFR